MVNPVKFTQDSGCLSRDEFLVIMEVYHVDLHGFLIVVYCTALLVWGISSHELIRINFTINF